MTAENTDSVKDNLVVWCPAVSPDHRFSCMAPAGHGGRHFAITYPDHEPDGDGLISAPGVWWER